MEESKENKITRLKFKEIRLSANLTQKDLSYQFKEQLSVAQIRSLENGKRKIRVLDLLLYIDVFNCNLDEILNRTSKFDN